MKYMVFVLCFVLCSCSIYECSFVPAPLKRITEPNSLLTKDDNNAIINDPVNNVAGVISCKTK